MKTKIILYTIIAFLGLVLVFAFKQSNTVTTKKYIFITVFETSESSKWDSKIIIDDGENKKEVILGKLGNVLGANETKIHQTIYEYVTNGFEIISSTNSYSSVALSKSEYILVKE